jgi:hypothetical protein
MLDGPELKSMKLNSIMGLTLKSALVIGLVFLASCSKQASKDRKTNVQVDSESYPIENSKLKNCHFKVQAPTYTFGATIEPNIIQCDEGVPKKIEILTPAPLPSGIQFSQNTLSLIGTANERVVQAPYDFYLENESGYVIIKIQISIQ